MGPKTPEKKKKKQVVSVVLLVFGGGSQKNLQSEAETLNSHENRSFSHPKPTWTQMAPPVHHDARFH